MDFPVEPKRGVAARERILEASAELFSKKGYHGTALGEILAACGLSKGGFYHHFASKEELFAATIERFLSARIEAADESLAGGEDASRDNEAEARVGGSVADDFSVETRLRRLFHSLLERGADFHSMLFEAVRASDEVGARIRALYRVQVKQWERWLREGQEHGEVRAFLDCASWAYQIVGVFEGASVLSALSGEPLTEEAVSRLFEALWRRVRRLDL